MTTATAEARMNNPPLMFPDAFKAMQAMHKATRWGEVPEVTLYLVHLRASQLNGCSVCCEMHSRELREAGESDERVFTVAAWRKAPFFSLGPAKEAQKMSTDREINKATLRRFHEATNSGDLELISKTIDEVFEPDALIRTPLPIETTGAQAIKEVFTRLIRVYPDLHVEIEDLIADGDKVVSRNTVTGTHLGDYLGHPPTGKPVTYNEIFIMRFAGGRIVETWGVVDVLSQLRQIGVVPGAVEQPHVKPIREAA
jgi:AhpD family alkylhydroperoxidase